MNQTLISIWKDIKIQALEDMNDTLYKDEITLYDLLMYEDALVVLKMANENIKKLER